MTSTVEVRVSGITLPRRRNVDDDSTNVDPGTKVYRRSQRGSQDEGRYFPAFAGVDPC